LDSSWNKTASSKIKLSGPEADIEINGESLISMLKAIEQRLNILHPNPELESDWKELCELGDAYRKLEAQIQAKMKTWEAISK
jgi:flagellar motility protein MotE (MotC chaperone)